jgi:hypothetical protein
MGGLSPMSIVDFRGLERHRDRRTDRWIERLDERLDRRRFDRRCPGGRVQPAMSECTTRGINSPARSGRSRLVSPIRVLRKILTKTQSWKFLTWARAALVGSIPRQL